MIEVVLSTVLLALVSTAIVSAVGYITGSERRRAYRLEAYEVANRLMLQYLDDPQALPDSSAPYRSPHTGRVFRFEFDAVGARVDGAGTRVLNQQSKLLRARVYEGVERGNAVERGQELAELTRYYNVMQASFRNEDAGGRIMQSQWFLESLMRMSQDGGVAPPRVPATPPGSGR